LLAEHVHDPNLKWTDAIRKRDSPIARDARYNTKILKQNDKERLFLERLNSLKGNLHNHFTQLLNETPIEMNSPWQEVRLKIMNDARFSSVERERSREELFARFLHNMKTEIERDFITMLSGFEKINKDSPTEGKELEQIKSMLRGDPRWKRLNPVPEHRDQLLVNYINDLREGRIIRGERGRELQRAERLERERELERINTVHTGFAMESVTFQRPERERSEQERPERERSERERPERERHERPERPERPEHERPERERTERERPERERPERERPERERSERERPERHGDDHSSSSRDRHSERTTDNYHDRGDRSDRAREGGREHRRR